MASSAKKRRVAEKLRQQGRDFSDAAVEAALSAGEFASEPDYPVTDFGSAVSDTSSSSTSFSD